MVFNTPLLCLTRLSCVFSVSAGHSGFRPTMKGNSPRPLVTLVLAEATSLYITSAACLIVALPAAEGCAHFAVCF